MPIVLHLLDFNKENSSDGLQNSYVVNDDDKKIYNNLSFELEDLVAGDNDDFGVMELEFYDINKLSNIAVDESTWQDSMSSCEIEGLYDCIASKDDNFESFEYILNVLNSTNDINYLDNKLNYVSKESFEDLVDYNIANESPAIIRILFYTF